MLLRRVKADKKEVAKHWTVARKEESMDPELASLGESMAILSYMSLAVFVLGWFLASFRWRVG